MNFDHETSLVHLLHRASQIAAERVTTALGDDGLTIRQIIVLTAIAAHHGASQTGIVAATGVDRSTLTDIVRRLQKGGLIARRRNKDDARAYAVRITDAGERVLKKTIPVIVKVEAELAELLPAKRHGELVALLGDLTKAGARVEA